jgi:glutamate/tyrosine decarboxylase-like PLP-dependent enzyme
VIDELAAFAEPGLMAMPSGRFFGWVIGGTLPAALAADWLVTAWDQNAGMRFATPAAAVLEETAACWLLDLLGLPPGADVRFTTGGTMANFVGLAAGRQWVLERAGWDLDRDGLAGSPRVQVFVGRSVTTLSISYCATSTSAHPSSSMSTSKDDCGQNPGPSYWTPVPARPSSACRLATCIPEIRPDGYGDRRGAPARSPGACR